MNWDTGPTVRWDMIPAIRWDQPLFPIRWRNHMNIYKLLVDFLYWGEPRFGTKANTIVTSMTTEPMTTLVPDPLPAAVPTRVAAQAALADYQTAAVTAEDGSKAAIADRNEKRAILEQILAAWAPYLELLAKQAESLAILENSGYDVRQPIQPVPQPLPAPVLEVSRNGYSGEIHGRAKRIVGAMGYEGQICTGTDTVEANWRTSFFSSGCSKLKWVGLTPGQVYSFRLRALGRDGWSPWSDIGQLMAT